MPLHKQVLAFPSLEDKNTMHKAIMAFLQCPTGLYRKQMLMAMHGLLTQYGISKINFSNYSISQSRRSPWPTVRAQDSITGQHCPACGSAIYNPTKGVRILNIWEQPSRHYVTYGCSCGKIFGKWEQI